MSGIRVLNPGMSVHVNKVKLSKYPLPNPPTLMDIVAVEAAAAQPPVYANQAKPRKVKRGPKTAGHDEDEDDDDDENEERPGNTDELVESMEGMCLAERQKEEQANLKKGSGRGKGRGKSKMQAQPKSKVNKQRQDAIDDEMEELRLGRVGFPYIIVHRKLPE